LEFTAMTLFGCPEDGTQDGFARWNTGPVDACWDLFLNPLTDYNLSKREWIGWQFASLDGAQGFVQAFRREHCMYTAAELKLRGLDPYASYVFTNLDTGESQTLVGRDLLGRGLAVSITEQPGSAVITYQKEE